MAASCKPLPSLGDEAMTEIKMTNIEKIFDFLQAIAPKSATNDEIRAHTGIRNHTAVYQDTQLLMLREEIRNLIREVILAILSGAHLRSTASS